MNLTEYANQELQAAGLFDEDSDYNGSLGKSVLDLIKFFADQGHSGASAHRAIALFQTLASYRPLGPLTGADDEWAEVADGLFQNKRCFHVFKDGNRVYNSEGRVFVEPSGAQYIKQPDSRVDVTFPYVPHTEYVNVPCEWEDEEDGQEG